MRVLLAALMALALASCVSIGISQAMGRASHLTGRDCGGARGPLYAGEEDRFTSCTTIERN